MLFEEELYKNVNKNREFRYKVEYKVTDYE